MSRSIENRLHTCALWSGAALFGAATFLTITATAQPGQANASPVFGVALPQGYRDWRLISVAHEAGANNDIRAILGNDIAV